MKPTTGNKVLWSELYPDEFKLRIELCPIVYLPLGLCEPHGQISVYGLDTIKAEYICVQAAQQFGGIVAPSLGYHIHEVGYHARWLEDEVGEHNVPMTSIPPHIFFHFLLYQLRSFVNAGFKGIVLLTGHGGGNQEDLRDVSQVFMKHIPIEIVAVSDAELVQEVYQGDHAGKFEISQLQYIKPGAIDLTRIEKELFPEYGGRLARGSDALEATAEYGEAVLGGILDALSCEIDELKQRCAVIPLIPKIRYEQIEHIWQDAWKTSSSWKTLSPKTGQQEVSPHSQWKPYEQPFK